MEYEDKTYQNDDDRAIEKEYLVYIVIGGKSARDLDPFFSVRQKGLKKRRKWKKWNKISSQTVVSACFL